MTQLRLGLSHLCAHEFTVSKTVLIFFVVVVWILNQLLTFLYCPLSDDKRITLLSTLSRMDWLELFTVWKFTVSFEK